MIQDFLISITQKGFLVNKYASFGLVISLLLCPYSLKGMDLIKMHKIRGSEDSSDDSDSRNDLNNFIVNQVEKEVAPIFKCFEFNDGKLYEDLQADSLAEANSLAGANKYNLCWSIVCPKPGCLVQLTSHITVLHPEFHLKRNLETHEQTRQHLEIPIKKEERKHVLSGKLKVGLKLDKKKLKLTNTSNKCAMRYVDNIVRYLNAKHCPESTDLKKSTDLEQIDYPKGFSKAEGFPIDLWKISSDDLGKWFRS